MNNTEFTEIVEDQFRLCAELLLSKGEEYDSDSGDRFHSFKVAAKLQGETPLEALAGMMAKHTISVYDLIHSGCRNTALWNEKITDHINYLLLLKGMVLDENGGLK